MIPLLLFLLGCAAIYVGTVEAAFSALMRLSLRLMAERNGRGDRLGRYLNDPIRLFIPARLLLGLIFSLATVLLAVLIGSSGLRQIGVLLLSVAAFIIVSEHFVPLLIIQRDPERVLTLLLPSFDPVARMLHPIVVALVGVAAAGRKDQPAGMPDAEPEEGEVAHAYLEQGEQHGLIEREERRLLQSIVDFGDTMVREVMTPRPDIVAIHGDATYDELRAIFHEQEYSRVPVYQENLDNILGFVYVKDLILLDATHGDDRPLPRLLRPAHVVPETKKVSELLKEFQRRQVQLAIVVDEYGGTAGLVTVEDLLEEIVGEIRDEYDVETEPIVDEGGGRFLFSGKVSIGELADRLDVDIERQGFETVGGYVLSKLGRVPAVGEVFEIEGLSFEVVEAERRRINRVRVRRQPVAQQTGQ
jgi:putative hemolysin